MMRSQTTPLHQSWRLRDHNPAGPSFSPGTSPPPLPELQTGLSFLSPAYRVQNEKSALHTNEQCGALETAWSPPLLTDCWIHSHPAYTSLWTRYPKALKHLEKDKSWHFLPAQEVTSPVFGEWDFVKWLWWLLRAGDLYVHKVSVSYCWHQFLSKGSCKENMKMFYIFTFG